MARAVALQLENSPAAAAQLALFPDEEPAPKVKGKKRKSLTPGPSPAGRGENNGAHGRGEEVVPREATTLDRVHAAMLLQRSGQANALRNLLKAEQERGPDFLRLANALSALYPRESEEKRLLDAMLLAVPRR